MSYRFKHHEIDFEVVLEQVHSPMESDIDEEDWQAYLKGEVVIYSLLITSKKGSHQLLHIHSNQPMAMDTEERKEDLECLALDTELLKPIIVQWKLEESAQDAKPPWAIDT
jgi:hypothetical protein